MLLNMGHRHGGIRLDRLNADKKPLILSPFLKIILCRDVMIDAPAPIDKAQLDELGLKTK